MDNSGMYTSGTNYRLGRNGRNRRRRATAPVVSPTAGSAGAEESSGDSRAIRSIMVHANSADRRQISRRVPTTRTPPLISEGDDRTPVAGGVVATVGVPGPAVRTGERRNERRRRHVNHSFVKYLYLLFANKVV